MFELNYNMLSPEIVLPFCFTVSLRNIKAFNTALMGNTPLFQIETILSAPEIVLHPKSNEVYKLIMHCVRGCVESTKVKHIPLLVFSLCCNVVCCVMCY